MGFKVGDTVEVIDNRSGGFENGSVVKVVAVFDRGRVQNLDLSDGDTSQLHTEFEVKLID